MEDRIKNYIVLGNKERSLRATTAQCKCVGIQWKRVVRLDIFSGIWLSVEIK